MFLRVKKSRKRSSKNNNTNVFTEFFPQMCWNTSVSDELRNKEKGITEKRITVYTQNEMRGSVQSTHSSSNFLFFFFLCSSSGVKIMLIGRQEHKTSLTVVEKQRKSKKTEAFLSSEWKCISNLCPTVHYYWYNSYIMF